MGANRYLPLQPGCQRATRLITYNYALGLGYIERRIVFEDVGTSLRVGATILSDGQIRLRLTPRISYFSIDRPGAIDFTEAART